MPAKRGSGNSGRAKAGKAAAAKGTSGNKPKPGASKPRPKRSAPSARPALDELAALLPELDDAALAALLEQAKVHRYNMEIDRLNAIAGGAGTDNSSHAPRDAQAPGELRMERSADGATYHIVAGSDWKMFTAEEMAALVRITRSGEGIEEVARRIRSWLSRERKDVYLDLGLDGPSIGRARDIAELIGRTFPKRS